MPAYSTVYSNMKRSRSKRGRSHAPLFVSKLLQMVENPELKDVISWSPQGESFLIHSVARFTNEVLPRYFKHSNYSSFVRQLNMYGFHKGNHPEAQAYFHQNFRPGNKAKLRLVTRAKREEREEQQVAVIQNQVVQSESTKELQELRAKHKGLQEMCRHFFLQNQKLMQENTALLHKMKTDTINRNNRLENICSTLALPNPSLDSAQPQADTPHLRRVRALLQQLYQGISQREQQRRNRREQQQAEDQSYLSIHDFMNAQDYDIGLDLEDSR